MGRFFSLTKESFQFKFNVKRVCWYFGLALLYLPIEVGGYWGNLVVYVDSYTHIYNPSRSNSVPWLISLNFLFWGFAMMIASILRRKLTELQVVIIGALLYDLGIFFSYFAVQKSMGLLNFTMGVMCGSGYGLIVSIVLFWVRSNISADRLGFVFASIYNWLNIGAFLMNYVMTLYINPNNIEASLPLEDSKVYTDAVIIDRVPSVFLVLTLIAVICHCVAITLIVCQRYCFAEDKDATATCRKSFEEDVNSDKGSQSVHPMKHNAPPSSKSKHMLYCKDQPGFCNHSSKFQCFSCNQEKEQREGLDANNSKKYESTLTVISPISAQETTSKNGILSKCDNGTCNEQLQSFSTGNTIEVADINQLTLLCQCDKSQMNEDMAHQIDEAEHNTQGDNDMIENIDVENEEETYQPKLKETLWDALKSRYFYVICLALFVADISFICVLNFYKKFAEAWIHDDHFLAKAGGGINVTIVITRFVAGVFIDRKGVKLSTVVFIFLATVNLQVYFFSAMTNRYLFTVLTSSLAGLSTALYLIFPVVSAQIYSNSNFTDIFGAIMSTSIITNLFAPIVMDSLLVNFGWFGLFTTLALLSFVVMCIVIIALPE